MSHLPEVSFVHYEHADEGYIKLITAPEKPFAIQDASDLLLKMRSYLLYVHRLGVCPFTSLLESANGYFFKECNIPIRRMDFLHDVAQLQEEAMASIMPDTRVSRLDTFPAITLVTAFTGKDADEIGFYEMLEEVRSERRLDLIDKRMTIAIAHPLHPLGGNDNGTGKYGSSELPLFVSEVPLMLTRYLHPLDERFMHSKEELQKFAGLFLQF